MQESQYGNKVIKNEQSGVIIPDYQALLAKSNEQFRERNKEEVKPDLTVKASGIFMMFNKAIQTKMQYVKMLGAASMAVDNVINQIVALDFNSIMIDITPLSIRIVIAYTIGSKKTFEIEVHHADYATNSNCKVRIHVFKLGNDMPVSYDCDMDKIQEIIKSELR